LGILVVFVSFSTAAWAGGVIASAETKTGAYTAPSYQDAWTFTAAAGERVVITASGTDAVVYPEIYLYPPNGGELETSTTGAGSSKRLDYQLLQTGTYTIIVQDNLLNTTGTFDIALTKIPPGLGPGVYNPYPHEGISTNGFIGYLNRDAVPNATGYDVYFGEDVIDPLVKIGNNISLPFLVFPDMTLLTVYCWLVMAHNPRGDIPGPIQWFKTGVCDCEGDIGNSGSVGPDDLDQFVSVFGRSNCGLWPPCAGNLGTDFAYFIKDFGRADCPLVDLAESFDGPEGPQAGRTTGRVGRLVRNGRCLSDDRDKTGWRGLQFYLLRKCPKYLIRFHFSGRDDNGPG